MSFTTDVKNEICLLSFSKMENIVMLSGFVRNNMSFVDDCLVLSSENPKIARLIYSLFKELYDIVPIISQGISNNFGKKNLYSIVISDKLSFIMKDLMVFDDNNKYLVVPKDYFLDSEDLERAYLRGCFLASGSVNDPKKSRYHLEFIIDSSDEASLIVSLLDKFYITGKVISRDKGFMTYVKEAEKIGDFLRIISANKAVLYYEDIRIYRDHKNMTNRLNNCEQANVDKTIVASEKQIEDINIIVDNLGLDFIDDKLKIVISYRLKYPEVSLGELSNIISYETEKPITKSGLNHRFRKIHEMAIKIKNKE